MFDSQDNALAFRDDLVQELDRVETDGWQITPTLDGAEIKLGDNVALVRGQLDGQGYRVTDHTTDDVEDDGWIAKLKVMPA